MRMLKGVVVPRYESPVFVNLVLSVCEYVKRKLRSSSMGIAKFLSGFQVAYVLRLPRQLYIYKQVGEEKAIIYPQEHPECETCTLSYCHVEAGFRSSSSFVPLALSPSVGSFSMVDHCSECCRASSALISCNGLDLSNDSAS